MPEFRHPAEITADAQGDGWSVSTLADGSHVPGMAMKARLWRLDAGATGPEETWDESSERFLYVVSGSGRLVTGARVEELGLEDMVWIERGDRFRLSATGAAGLSVLDATST